MTVTRETILKRAAERNVEFVSLQYTDIVGMVKNVTIPVSELPDCLDHGVWFDGSSLEGFARVAESDMYLVPDLETFAIIPWDEAAGFVTARMICDVHTPEGKPFAGDPRYALRRALDVAHRMGLTFYVGPEVEFFLFRSGPDGRPALIPHDVAGYFDATTDAATHIRRRMVRALSAFGIEVEATHHEGALSQHEIDLRHTDGLRAADHLVTTRSTLKSVCDVHAQANRPPEWEWSAYASEPRRRSERQKSLFRPPRSLLYLETGAPLYRRVAGARTRHDRGACAARKLV